MTNRIIDQCLGDFLNTAQKQSAKKLATFRAVLKNRHSEAPKVENTRNDDFMIAHQKDTPMTDSTIPLAAAETALRKLSSTITRDDETISLQAALDALRGVAGEGGMERTWRNYAKDLEAVLKALDEAPGITVAEHVSENQSLGRHLPKSLAITSHKRGQDHD